uniref:hypothetical protein n=1 Tax=Candidatus Electrothrix sp. TaxID=2170559 RepID=UPI004057AF66
KIVTVLNNKEIPFLSDRSTIHPFQLSFHNTLSYLTTKKKRSKAISLLTSFFLSPSLPLEQNKKNGPVVLQTISHIDKA